MCSKLSELLDACGAASKRFSEAGTDMRVHFEKFGPDDEYERIKFKWHQARLAAFETYKAVRIHLAEHSCG